ANTKMSSSPRGQNPITKKNDTLATIDTVDLIGEESCTAGRTRPKSQEARAAEPYFRRLFAGSRKDPESQPTDIPEDRDDMYLSTFDSFESDGFGSRQNAQKGDFSDHGSVFEIDGVRV